MHGNSTPLLKKTKAEEAEKKTSFTFDILPYVNGKRKGCIMIDSCCYVHCCMALDSFSERFECYGWYGFPEHKLMN